MKQLLTQMLTTFQAVIMGLWVKIRVLSQPAFWKQKVLGGLRDFFTRIFNVKPRHKGDYYATRRWLVSRRLVVAVVVVSGVLSLVLIWLLTPAFKGGSQTAEEQLRTYRYNSLALRFYSGNTRILANDGHVAYVGQVGKGEATGQGVLYAADGTVLYEGAFEASMFNGQGILNWPDGTPKYEGGFANNLYSGMGTEYRPNGVVEYEGSFSQGLRNGTGTLYNSGGNPIFTGTFVSGTPLLSELVGKPTGELAGMYTGKATIYNSASEFCVVMNEMNAVYAVRSGANTVENEWTVDSIYVLGSQFATAERSLTSLEDLYAYFGQPAFSGSTYVNLPEAVAINLLAAQPQNLGRVEMALSAEFDNALTVDRYDPNAEVYIYSFVRDGMVYTFYCAGASSNFLMYSIELA